MNPSHPSLSIIDTPYLRNAYTRGQFSFSEGVSALNRKTVVLIGSCRIVPYLNYLRVYNAMAKHEAALHLICLNPVEMWGGLGHHVADGVNETLKDFRFGDVDYLICEHVQYCGLLNTVRSSAQNIYDNLDCSPVTEIRLPNWNEMFIFDLENEQWDINRQGYAAMGRDERIQCLRERTERDKAKYLSHCSKSTYPDLADWVSNNWLDIRMGWTSNHPTLSLLSQIFGRIVQTMGLDTSCGFLDHPICRSDLYKSTAIPITELDWMANKWRFA